MQRNIRIIYLKELLEVIKDRRTLVLMVAIPTLVMPLLMHFAVMMTKKAAKKSAAEKISYAIFNEQALPELAQALNDDSNFQLVEVDGSADPRQLVLDEKVKLSIRISDQAKADVEAGRQANIDLFYNNASMMSKVESRGKYIVRQVSEDLRNAKLNELGFGEDQRSGLLEPLNIVENGTADFREILGERAGGFLPYMFIIFCFMGSLYPAIDLAAGEKERGTLETLLLTPVPRLHLVVGKFLVVFTTGIISALLSTLSMGVWLFTQGKGVEGVAGEIIKNINPIDLVMVMVMLVPLAAMFGSLLLTVSIYARSFKEAQSLATPFNFLIIIPAMVGMIPGVTLNSVTSLIPITNVALAVKELVKGTMNYNMLWMILGSSCVIASIFILFCVKFFQREEVLFRE